MRQISPIRSAISGSIALGMAVSVSGCGETSTVPDSEQPGAQSPDEPLAGAAPLIDGWDGKKRRDTDAIVQLNLSGVPTAILLNGVPATAVIDKEGKSAKVLIASDDTGISCENTFIVTFEGGEKGQLAANHCHGDTVFEVVAGEFNNSLLTKEDVDNPQDDAAAGDQVTLPLSHEWSANGFEQLPSRYEWAGGVSAGGDGAFAALGVPETDDTVFTASCDSGDVLAFVLLYDREPQIGMTERLKIEVEGRPVRSYTVSGSQYGEGAAFSLRLPASDPVLADMAQGQWAYWQMGSDSGRGKIRVSLEGANAPISGLIDGC